MVTGCNHRDQKYGACQLHLDIFIAYVHVPSRQLLLQAALVNFSCQAIAPPTGLHVASESSPVETATNYNQLYCYCECCTSCTMLVHKMFTSTKDIPALNTHMCACTTWCKYTLLPNQ